MTGRIGYCVGNVGGTVEEKIILKEQSLEQIVDEIYLETMDCL